MALRDHDGGSVETHGRSMNKLISKLMQGMILLRHTAPRVLITLQLIIIIIQVYFTHSPYKRHV